MFKTTPENITGKQVVTQALELRGLPYEMGGKDMDELDCSGFVVMVLRLLGHNELPDGIYPSGFEGGGAHQIYQYCQQNGKRLPLEQIRRIAGSLLFTVNTRTGQAKHIAYSSGYNTTIEARGEGYGCGEWPMRPGWHKWGYLIPNIKYGGIK